VWIETADHNVPAGPRNPGEFGDNAGGVGGELADRDCERDVELPVSKRQALNVALDEIAGEPRAGDRERGWIAVDAGHAGTGSFEPGREPSRTAAGVTHAKTVERRHRVEQQLVFDGAGVGAPRLVKPRVVGGGVDDPAVPVVDAGRLGQKVMVLPAHSTQSVTSSRLDRRASTITISSVIPLASVHVPQRPTIARCLAAEANIRSRW
jgi:hypothetical protein